MNVSISDIASTSIPSTHGTATFESFQPRTSMQKEALDGLRWWATDKGKIGENLLLIGPNGSGKTHLLAAAAKRRRVHSNQTIAFVDVPTYRTARRGGDWAAYADFSSLESVDLAVVDDFGADDVTSGAFEFVTMLVESRFYHEKPTLAASEFTVDQLLGRGYATTLRQLTWHDIAFHLDLPGRPSGATSSQRIPDLLLRPVPGIVPPICPLV